MCQSTCVCVCVFVGELTALKQFLGDRDLGSDEQQQVDGETQQLFIPELVRPNQVRVSRLQSLGNSKCRQNKSFERRGDLPFLLLSDPVMTNLTKAPIKEH